MEYAYEKSLLFGKDIVFTYGPLGFLNSDVSQAHLILFRSVFAFFWAGVIALSAIGASQQMPTFVRWFFLVWLILFSTFGGMEFHIYLVLAYCVTQILFTDKWRPAIIACTLACLAVVSLIKFTMLIAAVATVVICAAVKIAERKWREAALVPGGYLLLFICGWLAIGQQLSLLIPWLRASMEIASGYTAAMSYLEHSQVVYFCMATMVAFILTVMITLKSAVQVPARVGMVTILSLYAFFIWKHGIVRPDKHTFWFFMPLPSLLSFLWISPLQAFDGGVKRIAATACLILAIISCLAGMEFQSQGVILERALGWPEYLKIQLVCIGNLLTGQTDKVYTSQRDPAQSWAPNLPQIQAITQKERVDVMNCRQWVAIANRLNYFPRPLIQGYSAYTPYLIDLNKDFYRDKNAPAFVLLKMETIDNRFPTLDDSGALGLLLHRYKPVTSEQSFTLLRRIDAPSYQLETILNRTIHFGEALDISPWAGEQLFMTVDMKPSLTVRLRRIFYQEPRINILIQSEGKERKFRYIPIMGTAPFLISPLLETNDDVIKIYDGKPSGTVSSVIFEEPANFFGKFPESFTVKLYRAPGFQKDARKSFIPGL
jgi:hypothetical protein